MLPRVRKSFKLLYIQLYMCPPDRYLEMIKSRTALQPGRVIRIIRVNRVTFCPGQPGLTCFIKYPGLTRILYRITCINNVLDNVSISCQSSCSNTNTKMYSDFRRPTNFSKKMTHLFIRFQQHVIYESASYNLTFFVIPQKTRIYQYYTSKNGIIQHFYANFYMQHRQLA